MPATTDELLPLLRRHVYAEAIRLDDHSLRVLTDDDEVQLAYFFFDDHVIAAEPARLAYLLHDTRPLPDGVGEPQAFQPDVPVDVAAPTGRDDPDLGVALERANRWPGFNVDFDPWPDLPDEHDAAHRRALDLVEAAEFTDGRRPEASLLRVGEHIAQLARHHSDVLGYQQWFLFDSIWAGSHPDLAQSLLRYANAWDPLAD